MRTERRLLALILTSAVIITVARLLAPFEVGKDQALQLEAAIRLADGEGLTSTYFSAPPPADISQPVASRLLVWWPPVFSLAIAGLLKLGLSLSAALKLFYATVSLLGWLGWGRIASRLLAAPIEWRNRKLPVGWVIAALAPVFFTPFWAGTDIILWAGIPYVVLLLAKTAHSTPHLWPIIVAGMLLGFLYGVRYASVSAIVAGFLILLCNCLSRHPLNPAAWLKQTALLCLGIATTALPVVLYMRLFSGEQGSLPVYIDPVYEMNRLTDKVGEILFYLPVLSNSLFGSTIIEDVFIGKLGIPAANYAVGIFCLAALVVLPLAILGLRRAGCAVSGIESAQSMALLPIALMILLVTMVFITDQVMIGVRRYHEPIRLSGLLAFYFLAALEALPRQIKWIKWIKWVKLFSLAVVAAFLCYICLLLPANLLGRERRDDLARIVLGYTPARSKRFTSTSQEIGYPSARVYSLKENSRAHLQAICAASPQAVVFADNYPFYVYDNFPGSSPRPGKTMRKLPRADFWQTAYTSRPLKVFWALNDNDRLWQVIPQTNRRLVFEDRFEKTKIYESDLPSGYRFGGEPK